MCAEGAEDPAEDFEDERDGHGAEVPSSVAEELDGVDEKTEGEEN